VADAGRAHGLRRRAPQPQDRPAGRMDIHQLRHYSATELIGAGIDLRTVAGRLSRRRGSDEPAGLERLGA